MFQVLSAFGGKFTLLISNFYESTDNILIAFAEQIIYNYYKRGRMLKITIKTDKSCDEFYVGEELAEHYKNGGKLNIEIKANKDNVELIASEK